MSGDNLGDRMKGYENRHRHFLNRRTYTVIRLDGKAFHTFTRRFKKPYDNRLDDSFCAATIQTIAQIQGFKVAYHQSDEVSILITDFDKENTDLWFGGNIQKITSVTSSIFTHSFNAAMQKRLGFFERRKVAPAFFDCRVFQLPTVVEVTNYFRWRNQDCIKNAVSNICHQYFSDKELHGKSTILRRQMLSEIGKDIHTWPAPFIYGTFFDDYSYQAGWDLMREEFDSFSEMFPQIA